MVVDAGGPVRHVLRARRVRRARQRRHQRRRLGHGFRRYVFIHSDLLEVGGAAREPDALRFVISHEVGHIAAGHTSYSACPRHLRRPVGPARRHDPEPGAGVHGRQLRLRPVPSGGPTRDGGARRGQVPRPLRRRRHHGRPSRDRAGLLRLVQRRPHPVLLSLHACATGAVRAGCSGGRRNRGSGGRPPRGRTPCHGWFRPDAPPGGRPRDPAGATRLPRRTRLRSVPCRAQRRTVDATTTSGGSLSQSSDRVAPRGSPDVLGSGVGGLGADSSPVDRTVGAVRDDTRTTLEHRRQHRHPDPEHGQTGTDEARRAVAPPGGQHHRAEPGTERVRRVERRVVEGGGERLPSCATSIRRVWSSGTTIEGSRPRTKTMTTASQRVCAAQPKRARSTAMRPRAPMMPLSTPTRLAIRPLSTIPTTMPRPYAASTHGM